MNIKKIIKRFIPSTERNKIRRWKRKFLNFFKHKTKTSISDLQHVLVNEFGIQRGDHIIVSSSFGQLDADYSPLDVVNLLKELVGTEGVIMMPYYPPMNSTEWSARKEVFDMRNTRSGMGVLTNVFAHSDGVIMSKHPTKAVCVWGKDAEKIVSGHETATTPFFWDSPYGRLLKMGSKSLGKGQKNIPIFHTFEDVLSPAPSDYYQEQKYSLELISTDGTSETVETYVHSDAVLNKCVAAGDYVRDLKCASYKRRSFGYAFLYVIDNDDLFERCKLEFARGNSRIRN